MNGKIRIKFGSMEIDFEGSEQFLKEEFLEMIREVCALAKESGVNPFQTADSEKSEIQNKGMDNVQLSKIGSNTVAQKLAVKSGADLVMSAAAKLTFIDGKDKFSSRELSSEMRQATSYFKETYSKNLGNNLKNLVKAGKLNDVGGGNFSIPANSREDFVSKLK